MVFDLRQNFFDDQLNAENIWVTNSCYGSQVNVLHARNISFSLNWIVEWNQIFWLLRNSHTASALREEALIDHESHIEISRVEALQSLCGQLSTHDVLWLEHGHKNAESWEGHWLIFDLADRAHVFCNAAPCHVEKLKSLLLIVNFFSNVRHILRVANFVQI